MILISVASLTSKYTETTMIFFGWNKCVGKLKTCYFQPREQMRNHQRKIQGASYRTQDGWKDGEEAQFYLADLRILVEITTRNYWE